MSIDRLCEASMSPPARRSTEPSGTGFGEADIAAINCRLGRSRGGASFRDGLFGGRFSCFEFEADFVAVEL